MWLLPILLFSNQAIYEKYFSEVLKAVFSLLNSLSKITRFIFIPTNMIYPIEAVVLKKNRISENRLVFTCFSSEYGKIDIFYTESKGSPKLDTLSHFTGRIMTKEKNTLSQIYKVSCFSSTNTYEVYDVA